MQQPFCIFGEFMANFIIRPFLRLQRPYGSALWTPATFEKVG